MTQINLFHSDSWKLVISNVPYCSPDELQIFESFVKSVNFPEYGLDIDETTFQGYKLPLPIGHSYNRDNMGLLQIEFKICENFQNYLKLFQIIQDTKYGQNINTQSGKVMDFNITEISIILLDNMKRNIGRFKFIRNFVVGLSALGLSYGTGEELTFISNINFTELFWEPADVPECEK